jgi:signal transduction histidine kinase
MPAIGLLRRSAPEIAWVVFAAANLAALVLLPQVAAIPFHFIWISLMVLYGARVWPARATAAVLGAVMVATTVALLPHVAEEGNWVELTEVPLMAAVFCVMVVYARRRQSALDTAHEAARRQLEFVRDASHQLRTPITVARGHAELVAMELAGTDHCDDLDIVLDELSTLGRMSRNLLALEQIDDDATGGETIDLSEFLQHARRRWAATSDRRWRVGAPEGTAIKVNVFQLGMALDALIENAVAATRDGDEISLFAHLRIGTVLIEVADSGPGVPAEHADRIFDRFFRLESSPPGGSGLGLSIVRSIAEAHGGVVSVTPARAGGAAFRISLPRVA